LRRLRQASERAIRLAGDRVLSLACTLIGMVNVLKLFTELAPKWAAQIFGLAVTGGGS
jgi:hypothetical protein